MIHYAPASRCRASGENLKDARLLFEVQDCPFPGVYPESAVESLSLRSPLRVVQAKQSGLVQLAHVFDGACYRKYLFAGGVSRGYTAYLKMFAQSVANTFPPATAILEVGCGDGTLLGLIQAAGLRDIFGIDPSQPARQNVSALPIASGYFPADLPAHRRARKYDLIILRHVLEHLETPSEFVATLAGFLKPAGQLWVEVPDLESAVRRQTWGNFYQIHCNYFEAATLDAMLGSSSLVCHRGEVVEVFGGSLLRRYSFGPVVPPAPPTRWEGIAGKVGEYRRQLRELAERMPNGCAGYGAAERTAVSLGLCPALVPKLRCLSDGNPLLAGRFLGGTGLPIISKEKLVRNPPPAVLLFAISHAREIIAEFKARLPGNTLVGMVGADFCCQLLTKYP
jgi:SAM-dependent methyltransferase